MLRRESPLSEYLLLDSVLLLYINAGFGATLARRVIALLQEREDLASESTCSTLLKRAASLQEVRQVGTFR